MTPPEKFLAEIERQNIKSDLPPDVLWHLTQALGKIMSELSEEYIFAGWLGNWTHTVAEAHVKGDTDWLDEDLYAAAAKIHVFLGFWADYRYDADDDDEWYAPYVWQESEKP